MSAGINQQKREGGVARWARLLLLAPMLSLPIITYIHSENPAVAFCCFMVCVMAGVVLQSWVIIGTLFGVLCGCVFQPLIRGGPREAQIVDEFQRHVLWTAVGFVVGYWIETATRRPSTVSNQPNDGDAAKATK